MMTKIEGSTKIVNFMTPRAGVLMSGVTICHYSEYVLSFTLSIYSTLIAIVLFIMMLLTYSIVDYSIILWWGCWYTFEPFWQEVGVKSLILRWPLRPVGLLLFFNLINMLTNRKRYPEKESQKLVWIDSVWIKWIWLDKKEDMIPQIILLITEICLFLIVTCNSIGYVENSWIPCFLTYMHCFNWCFVVQLVVLNNHIHVEATPYSDRN